MSNQYSKNRSHKTDKMNPLPLLLILGGLFALVIALIIGFGRPRSSVATIPSNGNSVLVADQQEINLGDVKLGQTVQASFKLTNTGTTPLNFIKKPYIEVREGC